MSDMVREDYSEELATTLSTDNEEGRLWVQTRFKNVPMCVLNNRNPP